MKNPQTLEALRDWLKTKPACERYDWTHPQQCLLGQYFKRLGAKNVCGGAWQDADNKWHRFTPQFFAVALAEHEPIEYTFGAALARAEKLIASQ